MKKITPDTDIKRRGETARYRQNQTRARDREKNELVGMLSIGDIATQSGFNTEIAEAICEISK
ncbi:MAG: hypothetical protein L6V93_21205 [Clostridiales bacterium]|nr:MAG: hypothetical protein L6V93_21205 [Clostridiales bacterium]